MNMGKCIFLNGGSSAGKTSLSRELQNTMDDDYFLLSIDQFFCTAPSYFHIDDPWIYHTDVPFPNSPVPQLETKFFDKVMSSFPKVISAFHHSIKAFLNTGNNIIVDHGFHRISWLQECVDLLHNQQVYLIKVFCNSTELERREKLRGDRPSGMALYQNNIVHRDVVYDLEIDTTLKSPTECALQIKDYILHASPRGFAAMYNIRVDRG